MSFLQGLAFDDVLLLPQYSDVLPSEADLRTEIAPGLVLNLPLLSAAMDTVTESRLAIAIASAGGMGFVHKNMSIEQQAEEIRLVKQANVTGEHSAVDKEGRLRVGAAVGCGPETMDRVRALISAGTDMILVDSSHGHSQGVMNTIKMIRAEFKTLPLIGGNVCTAEGVRALVESGADCVKIGIGPGSICTTRVVTGCGCPQFTAVRLCAEEARKLSIPIIADGGMRYSGDISKALAAGASAVMMGSMFAGTEEAPGERKLIANCVYKQYRGMGSAAAMAMGSSDRYFQSSTRKFVPEGVEGLIPFKGPMADTIYQITGGLRSCMGLVGCKTIPDMWNNCQFVQVSQAALRESHPHSLTSITETTNYSRQM